MYLANIIILSSLFLKYINTKDICDIKKNCVDCDNCSEPTQCNFDNIYCIQDNQYKPLSDVYNLLTNHYKTDPDITSFCNSRTISFESTEDSFTLFESKSSKLSGTTKSYSCEFGIINKYYYDHDTDQATLSIKINAGNSNVPENSKIKFDILFIYTYLGQPYLKIYTDESIRKSPLNRLLDKLSEIQIYINFLNKDSPAVLETLKIDIETDNPSEKIRLIYIIIIIILAFFILVIIGLIVIYYLLKRKVLRDRQRMIMEEEKKKNEKKELTEKFLKNELTSQIFNDKINLNDCDMCTICCDKFVLGESQVSVTPCSHVFHHECIEKWVKEKITNPHCPNCKFSFLDYMENKEEMQKDNKEILTINKNLKSDEVGHDKNQKSQEDNFPLSEQMRINSRNHNTENINNLNMQININNNNNVEEGSVHLSDNGNNND